MTFATTALMIWLSSSMIVCTNAYFGDMIDTNLQQLWDAKLYGGGLKYGLTYDTYESTIATGREYGSYDVENTVLPAETILDASSTRFYDNLFVIKQALDNISTKMFSLFWNLNTPNSSKAKLDLLISQTQSENQILEAVYNLAPYQILFD